uniref:Uncharacterized protein n=1 Tax=Acrobeloides nanus TaxID=290746 RepID=A0A914DNN0_9BILA
MLIFIKKVLLMIQQLNLKKLFDGELEASLIYKMLPGEECCFKMDSITKLPNRLTNFFESKLFRRDLPP